MTLRFTQTLHQEDPAIRRGPTLGHRGPARDWGVSPMTRGLRRGDPEIDYTPVREVGGVGIAMGRLPRPAASPAPVEIPEEAAAPKARRPHPPRWLDGLYRPRHLTTVGAEFLVALDPKKVNRAKGVPVLHDEAWRSLDHRMEYLQRKYLGLDLVYRGLAVEVDGHYWPEALAQDARWAEAANERARMSSKWVEGPLTHQDVLVWVAAFREASWDQIRSLHPPHQAATDALVHRMLQFGLLEARTVALGQGRLHTLRLTDLGVRGLKALPEGPDLLRRGFGPRVTGRGVGEYHEQAVGDGLGYFAHEVQEGGGEVTGFTLDAGLRREYQASRYIPDFRVEFTNSFGASAWDVEVVGLGKWAYTLRGRTGKAAATSTVRSFDPKGRAGGGQRDVGVQR